MRLPLLVAPLVVLAGLACGPQGEATGDGAGAGVKRTMPFRPLSPEESRAHRFQTALDALRAETGFPGATAAYLTAEGKTWAFATGLANVETNEPMNAEHRMLAASIGKTFVAATAIAAAHDGALGLDDPLKRWLGKEDWYPRLPNGATITLRHLLTHSSGLADHVDLDTFRAAMDRIRGQAGASLSPRELVELICDTKPLFAPGAGYSYTDTGYILIGMVLERAVGKPYYDQVRERFLDGLNLPRTRPSEKAAIQGLAAGYLEKDNRFGLPARVTGDDGALLYNPATEWTGGGLVSNPQDLVRWAKLLYEGEAIDGTYLDQLLESGYRGAGAEAVYGLGVYQYETPHGRAYGHGGWIPGYNSALRYFPEQKFAIAVQINRSFENDMNAIANRLAGAYLGV